MVLRKNAEATAAISGIKSFLSWVKVRRPPETSIGSDLAHGS